MERTKGDKSLSAQVKRKSEKPVEKKAEYDGDFGQVISTGSTLLDLAISGGRTRGGGLPGGIFVEVFGASGSGKTVLLSEIAGDVQRKGGDIIFHDPEARLNAQFAMMFGLEINKTKHYRPNTVTEVFESVKTWVPDGDKDVIHGIFADSLAALSTDLEMADGDPFGGRRAKEFSEQLRKTCRLIADKNYLMVCSNQIRDIIGATQYQAKTKTPGGRALEFYPSLRLEFSGVTKIKVEKLIAGKKQERVVGVGVKVGVFKSSIWKPFRSAPVTIIFDYGIDDISDCLSFLKTYTKDNVYTLNGRELSNSMEKAVRIVEDENMEGKLRDDVIDLWESIEKLFSSERKLKMR